MAVVMMIRVRFSDKLMKILVSSVPKFSFDNVLNFYVKNKLYARGGDHERQLRVLSFLIDSKTFGGKGSLR